MGDIAIPTCIILSVTILRTYLTVREKLSLIKHTDEEVAEPLKH